MSKKPPQEPGDNSAPTFPGRTSKKPVKSISVQRPVEVDEKTVIEENLDDANADPAPQTKPISKKRSAKASLPRWGRASQQPPEATSKSSVLGNPASPQEPVESGAHDEASQYDNNILELPPSPEHRKAKRRKTGWIVLSIATVILTGGWAVLYFSPLLAIEELQYEGLDLVAVSEAEDRTAPLLGTPLPQVNDAKMTELFADNPAVDHVTLRAEPPHGIVVIVNEHTPVAMSPRGKQYVVYSDDGIELAEIPTKKAQAFDLPVVASASDVADEKVFDTITQVLGSLPDELREQVRAASGTSIDSIELELSSGKTVMWGNTAHAEQKVLVLDALLSLDEGETAEISEYDVSAPDFPVTR